MKRLVKADTKPSLGTTFYRISIDQLRDAFSDENIWLQEAIKQLGFDSINFKDGLYGSRDIDGKVMYLCVTDGHDIEIRANGKTVMQDPESALDYYSPEHELNQFVQESTPDIIKKHITEWEFNTPLYDKWALDLLSVGNSFTSLMDAYQELV